MSTAPHVETPRLLSIQVGLPQTRGTEGTSDPMDSPWMSGFVKEPVAGPVRLGREGLEGDGQADRQNHGGPEKAVLAYAAEHYPAWRAELGRPEVGPGGFGENLTVLGQSEATVCVGDVYAVGPARIQVAQPRQPCWKLARRWAINDLPGRVEATGRTGWYLRVLAEGTIEAGLDVVLLERPCPEWTISAVARVVKHRKHDRDSARELAACPLLAPGLRAALARAADG